MSIAYRPEIDGLRTIAVLSVIIYHAEFAFRNSFFLTGGFLGVDIFFVISGFLISKIILKEIDTKKSFSFKNFYERRLRRIIPVLLLVMVFTIPFALLLMQPSAIVEYANSVMSSLFFSSNFYFYFSTTEYGATSSLLKPFLHTWTLSIEEQFYIFWPFFVIFLNRRVKMLYSVAVSSIVSGGYQNRHFFSGNVNV